MMNGVPMFMAVFGLLYGLAVVAVVVAILLIFWRWMRAHEEVARSLAGIERTLEERLGRGG